MSHALPADNPFSSPSTLPHQLPPFAEIREEHYRPALDAGFAEQLAEVELIASSPEPATFDNTIVALEKSGALLRRVSAVLFNVVPADGTPFLHELEAEYAPKFAAHNDAIWLDARLAERVETVRRDASMAERTDEDRYLVEQLAKRFRLAGAALPEDRKARLRELNAELSSLSTTFEQNLLADTNDLALVLDSRDELAGLDEGAIKAAEAAAASRGLEGKYVLTLVLPTGQPALASLENRDVRRRLHEASTSRGRRDNGRDNRPIALKLAQLRAERAELMGYRNHSEVIAQDSTAGSPEAINERLTMLAAPAARNAAREKALLQQVISAEQASRGEEPFTLEAWDWAFCSDKVRARDYAVDTAALRPWFEAERVLTDGVFFAANRVFGLSFTERPDLVAYTEDARVFEVFNADGSAQGLFILDLYTRDSKRGGAWMNSFVQQNRLEGKPTVVVNNLNVPKPPAGTPTLLTFDQVRTLFHEFGHALHGLLAEVTHPSLAGTRVPRDFVEFPSQVNEMWILWPEVVANYARHVETDEPLPTEQIDKIRAAEIWGEGFATCEYLGAAILDQAWHTLSHDEAMAIDDVEAFEASALAAAGLDDPALPPRYSTPYFQHVFAGGYSAGYYGYIWSEVLDADTVEWFTENGGATRENGQRFRERLLGVGGSKDPMAAYRDFRGRDARLEPLLKRRGLLEN